MFRESTTARTLLRAVVAASLAGLAVAATIWIDNPYIKVASAVLGALAAYLGIGGATIAEPFFGRQHTVEVPVPPADPEPGNL